MRISTIKKTRFRLPTGLAVVRLLICLCEQAEAANRSWIAGNGDWENSANGAPNSVPGVIDAAFIGNIIGVENDTVSLNAHEQITALQITDSMSVWTAGNLLEVSGDVLVSGFNFVDSVYHSSTN